MKNLFSFISILSITAISCSEIPTEIPPPATTVANGRVMLIEEFTGVKCGPCATGALLLKDILENSNGAAVAYAVHGEFLAQPHDNSLYDFRYPDSRLREQAATNLFAKPSITYNRVSENGATLVQSRSDTWQPFVDTELEKEQIAELIVDLNYDSDSRIVDVFVAAEALIDISGVININAVVSESHLIDPQQDGSDIIDDFEHEHVMKESLSNLDGDFLVENLSSGSKANYRFSYTIPEEENGEWKAENMEITIFISSVDLDGEVLQAIQVHVTE